MRISEEVRAEVVRTTYPEYIAEEEHRRYEVVDLSRHAELCDDTTRRGCRGRRCKCPIIHSQDQHTAITPGHGSITYTLIVIRAHRTVTFHFCRMDQFCGFAGSSGPSHATRSASLGVGGRCTGRRSGDLGGGSSTSSPPYLSKRDSSRNISSSSGDLGGEVSAVGSE